MELITAIPEATDALRAAPATPTPTDLIELDNLTLSLVGGGAVAVSFL